VAKVLAPLVVDAATVGVPLDEWRGYTATERAAIIHEHNSRVKRK
jgi:hypothetical protein